MIYAYTENSNGKYKKSALEVVSYAKTLADFLGDSVTAITINADDSPEVLYQFGASKVLNIKNEALKAFDPKVYASIISQLADGNYLIFSHSNESTSIAPYIVKEKGAAYITNVVSVPLSTSPFRVKRNVFSGKGIAIVETSDSGVVVTVSLNSVGAKENPVSGTEENPTVNIPSDPHYKVENTELSSGKIDLKEAEIVVSAGRGMKGPENWGIIEELAEVLGAATACSKPVADIGWRPHSEHVGQTGKAIAPKLYIATGISGAIQHLAGVNSSKTIVVINNDPEAPFFKSADYGIVGDLFEIIPKLIEKLKFFNN
ncbi:MAG: electron transfer flavoprotein subunit alpha/FixB family protein [Flavobacteriaceae bacterium]|jgi:electron transfer flavoprotein alpha subunit|nr:electron transfer flavoprotein subunit alpha/FixB family protein [Flavobacteriaceae bacterium]